MNVKEQIKRRVSIIEVASLYVDLKPAGKYYKALCPFHTEKTPSFYVMPDKDTFACYGCNKFGDIFTFIQEMENLGFLESMNFLIDKYNIPVEKKQKGKAPEKESFTDINQMALKYFQHNLLKTEEGKMARDYIKSRGLTQETTTLFSMGYALNQWDGLYNYLRKQSADMGNAVELGLLVRKNNRIYDRFRGRIIFPIFSESGTILAFGGRTIFDEASKYLNSPDSPVYKKSNHLYNFHLAKKAIREKKSALLVEGYMDVISLYQQGIKNATASLGTALTDNQIYLLKRFAENIFIFYDSDQAGIEAAVRGVEKMFEQNINPRIIILKEAKDPDEYIRSRGIDEFNHLLEQSMDGFRFLLKKTDRDFPDWRQVPERKRAALEKISISLGKISDPVVREGYKGLAGDFFRVNSDELRVRSHVSRGSESKPVQGLQITPAERIFLESILIVPEYIEQVKTLFSKKLFSLLVSGKIIRLIFENWDPENRNIDYKSVVNNLTDQEKAEFRSIYEAKESISKTKDQVFADIESTIIQLHDILNKRDAKNLNQEIKIAERENNLEKVRELTLLKYKFIKEKYNRKQEELF